MAKNVEQSSKLKVGAKDVEFFVEQLAEIIIKQLELDYEKSKESPRSEEVEK